MKLYNALLLISLVISAVQSSSRTSCTEGDNEFCENLDYEGACCAKLIVDAVNSGGSGASESVGATYFRCYDIDDITVAVQNDDRLVDTSDGGSGNTY